MERMVGAIRLDEQGTCIHLIDVLRDTKRRVCYMKVVGQAMLVKKFWLSIAKLANSQANEDAINTAFDFVLERGGVNTCILRGNGGYTKTETLLNYGLACYTIFLGDMFENQLIAMAKDDSRESLFGAFKRWASKLALPIPKDEEMLECMYDYLIETSDCVVQKSMQDEIVGLFFSEKLLEDSYYTLRKFVESYYRNKESA